MTSNYRLPLGLLDELLALASATQELVLLLNESLGLVSRALDAKATAAYLVGESGLQLAAQQGCDAALLDALGPISCDSVGRSISKSDTSACGDSLSRRLAAAMGCQLTRALPLLAHGESLGCLFVGADAGGALEAVGDDLLSTVGRAIGLGLENARLYQQTAQRLRETEVLYRVGLALSSTSDLDNVLSLVVRSATETISKANNGVLHLLDDETGELIPRALSFLGALGPDTLGRSRMRAGQGVAGLALETGEVINVSDVTQDPRFLRVGEMRRFAAMLVAPLKIGERRIGTLSVDSQEKNAFADSDERLLMTLATQAAAAIDRARLVSDLQQSVHDLRTTQQQLVQSEKLSAIGRLIAGVAHELNNPLQAVTGYAQLLLTTEGVSEGVQRDLAKIHLQAQRAAKIVQNLLTFARQQKVEHRSVNVNEVLERTVELRAYQLRVENIDIVLNLDHQELGMLADPSQLQTVFLNLINNAQDAIAQQSRRGRIEITSQLRGRHIHLEFADDGPGFAPDVQKHLFEPFLTTKEVGKGTGLGLSICFGIVSEHGGRIWASSEPGRGATFFIDLPASEQPTVSVEGSNVVIPSLPSKLVLVVDDEKDVALLLQRVLNEDGHRAVLARNAEAALQVLHKAAADGQHYDLVISDIKMPGMGGQGLYERLLQLDPELARHTIFISGDTTSPRTRAFLETVPATSLSKPFSNDDLRRALAQVFGTSDEAPALDRKGG